MYKLLLVDDDTEVALLNKKYFLKEGYDVKAVSSAEMAIQMLKSFSADCIILDVMMPGMDGFAACKEIRTFCNAPIIFLTGRTSEDDKVDGLLSGADDYMIKPYSLRELSARIQMHIKRHLSLGNAVTTRLEYPPLSLDIPAHKVYFDENEIVLSNREYELLYLFMSTPNELVSFEMIGDAVWGGYTDADRRTITVTASRLRKKLEEYPGLSDKIQTVWSKGYKFVTKDQFS